MTWTVFYKDIFLWRIGRELKSHAPLFSPLTLSYPVIKNFLAINLSQFKRENECFNVLFIDCKLVLRLDFKLLVFFIHFQAQHFLKFTFKCFYKVSFATSNFGPDGKKKFHDMRFCEKLIWHHNIISNQFFRHEIYQTQTVSEMQFICNTILKLMVAFLISEITVNNKQVWGSSLFMLV